MKIEPKRSSISLVIFGATGDLAWRKLIPALYNLFLDDLLPGQFSIYGVYRKPLGQEEWRKHLHEGTDRFSRRGKTDAAKWKAFAQHLQAFRIGDFNDTETFTALSKALTEEEKAWGGHSEHIYYLATPPALVETIVRHLDQARLTRNHRHSRVVVEKPFGRDLDSAQALNRSLRKFLDESQIYRIDHYLGKETVQNILAFRFANLFFEPIWNRNYIDHVQITVAEKIGVEHRGEYYDHAGALRDMIQNHLLQVLCLVAMEPPVAFSAEEIRDRKVEVLRALRPIPRDQMGRYAVRGQYGHGWIEGEHVPDYRSEPAVDPDSAAETFAALKLFVDNWRWQDVPFYLRTGKRLAQKVSQVVIQLRPIPHQSFPPSASLDWQPNRIMIDIQPHEAITQCLQVKHPGPETKLSAHNMVFRYTDAFKTTLPEAYETLLLDTMKGDATLFMRADQVEYAWTVVDDILKVWNGIDQVNFPDYAAGSWGPEGAETLIARDGRSWVNPVFMD